MKKFFSLLVFFSVLAYWTKAQTPTFTFECFCGYLMPADTNCDICNSTTQSRYFKGLLIRKNGTAFKWIEEPYTIIQNFDALTFKAFKELIFLSYRDEYNKQIVLPLSSDYKIPSYAKKEKKLNSLS